MSEIIKILKTPIILSVLAGALSLGIGATINNLLPWSWLTYFFVIVRSGLNLFAFTIDIPTLTQAIGVGLQIIISAWILMGALVVVKSFQK